MILSNAQPQSAPPAFILLGDLPKIGPFLTLLQDRGLAILVISGPPKSSLERRAKAYLNTTDHPFSVIADASTFGGDDHTGILHQVVTWSHRYTIAGVLATTEIFVEPAGLVTDLLKLPGVSLRASLVCRNKFLQRLYLKPWSPRSMLVTAASRDKAVEAFSGSFPVVVKPLRLWSSIGVRAFAESDGLCEYLTSLDPAEKVLVEERVLGREFNAEAIVVNGEPVFSAITQKGTNEDTSQFFAELIHTMPPTNLSDSETQAVHETHAAVIHRLGFGTGMAHGEYRLTPEGQVVLMEIAARPPGDGCLHLYHLTSGELIESALIDAALGDEVKYPTPSRRARQIYFDHHPGTLEDVIVNRAEGPEPIWVLNTGIWPSLHPGATEDPDTVRAVMVLKDRGERLTGIRESGNRAVTAILDCPISSDIEVLDQRIRGAVTIKTRQGGEELDPKEGIMQMGKFADSVLSTIDGNGNEVAGDVLRATYARLMRTNGYVHLVNVSDHFDHVGFLHEWGEFLPSPTGTVVGDMIPEPGMDDIYHSGNRQALFPHTEGYDLDDLPPRYLALWCIVPPSGEGGETTLFDGYKLIAEMTEDNRKHFENHLYRWTLAAGLRHQGMLYEAEHPVVETVDGEVLLRFSYNNVNRPAGDDLIHVFLERGKMLFDEQHVRIRYHRNDMLQWDNWRMLHARNAFEDSRRHLKRVQIRYRQPQAV